MPKKVIILSAIVFVSLCKPVQSSRYSDYKGGELLVRFAPKSDGKQRSCTEKNQILTSLGGAAEKRSFKIVQGLTLVELPPGQTVKDALKRFNKTKEILYAEPNYKIYLASTEPNDPNYEAGDLDYKAIYQAPPAEQQTIETEPAEGPDIETLKKLVIWLEEMVLEDEEVRELVGEDKWPQYCEDINRIIDSINAEIAQMQN